MIDLDKLSEELRRDEGWRDKVYTCSAGKQTVGFGHNLEDSPLPLKIGEQLLNHDIGTALKDCERFDWFYQLDDVRKRIIINMVFNLGANGVSKFKNMIKAIEDKDYDLAADEMKESRWYVQVGLRAERLVRMMREGA